MRYTEAEYQALKSWAESLAEDEPADLEKMNRYSMLKTMKEWQEAKAKAAKKWQEAQA